MNELRDHFGSEGAWVYIAPTKMHVMLDTVTVEWCERAKEYRIYVRNNPWHRVLMSVFGPSCQAKKLIDAAKAAIAVKALEDA
jgi:hypothetical protein